MINFLNKSKRKAKCRLSDCIKSDREVVCRNSIEMLKRELESVVNKYAEIEGGLTIEVDYKGRNKSYIKAGAMIKGAL